MAPLTFRTLLVALAACCLLLAPAHAQQKWYVHSELGNDNNSGRSPDAPFRTLERWKTSFYNLETTENDELLLSGTFRESLVINMSEPAKPQGLTVRGWTTADGNPRNLLLSRPVLRGDIPAPNNWTRAGVSNRYTTTVGFGLWLVDVVWNWDENVDSYGRNRGHLRKVASTAAVETTPYSWCYLGNQLHVNVTPPDSAPQSPSAGMLSYVPYGPNGGITIQWPERCTIRGIDSYLWLNDISGSYGISLENALDCTVVDCRTRDTSHHGIGYTGATRSGNTLASCEVRGLMGLVGDNSGDCFGYLSYNTPLSGGRINNCTAYCYSLLDPEGAPINPQRNIHGIRCGTTSLGQFVNDLRINNLTIYSYYPLCGPYCTPLRVEDAKVPTDPLDPESYGVRFYNLRVVSGGYMNISGRNNHMAFVDCDLDFSDNARRGLYLAGAISCAPSVGQNNRVLFQDTRIKTIVDNPNGIGWPGVVVAVRSGAALKFVRTSIQESGLRLQDSTAMMFGWIDPGGSVYARDCEFRYVTSRGGRRLCWYDGQVLPAQRDFDGCRYVNIGHGNSYTEWNGPSFGLPDIRAQVGWLSHDNGDLHGQAMGPSPLAPRSETARAATPGQTLVMPR